MTRTRSVNALLLCLPLGLVALSSCSKTGLQASAQPPDTIASISPVPAVTIPNDAAPAATELATTERSTTETPATPTTLAPTTEAPATQTPTTEPPTTVAPTTVAPTTVAPTTTVAPLVISSNVVAAPPIFGEVQAVGTRGGPATAFLQQRLLDLGFWNSGPDGSYGFATVQAVMAFQKYAGLDPSGRVDAATATALTTFTEKAHGQTNTGTLVEIDKAKQVLFLVVDGTTTWAFNTSTGSGIPYIAQNRHDPTKIETGDAQTPDGLYRTRNENPNGWWDGDLGQIYRPKYFNGGIAVHGMTVVPNHPASHGCVRLSTMAMDFIWDGNLIPLHTTVWVHS